MKRHINRLGMWIVFLITTIALLTLPCFGTPVVSSPNDSLNLTAPNAAATAGPNAAISINSPPLYAEDVSLVPLCVSIAANNCPVGSDSAAINSDITANTKRSNAVATADYGVKKTKFGLSAVAFQEGNPRVLKFGTNLVDGRIISSSA